MARAAMGFAFSFGWGEFGRMDRSLVVLLEEALGMLGEEDQALRAILLSRLSAELYWSPDRERRETMMTEALEIAERSGDRAALAHALVSAHVVFWTPETAERRFEIAERILRLAEEARDPELGLRGRVFRIADALELGDARRADRDGRAFEDQAERLRQPFFLWQAKVLRAMRATLEGRFAEAESLAAEAASLGERSQQQNARQLFAVQLFFLRLAEGRIGEIEEAVRSFAESHGASMPAWPAALARVEMELGRPDEAREALEPVARDDFARVPPDANRLVTLALVAETASALRDRPLAEAAYRALSPFAGRNVVLGPGAACYGPVDRFLGRLAATLDRPGDAVRHLECACLALTRLGALALTPAAELDLAAALAARAEPGDRERASL
ncbi:MAG: hypothetical protein ACREQY_19435, partial [Candidatus Binatia bacterium]